MDLVLTRGREGVQNPENLEDVTCTCPPAGLGSLFGQLWVSDDDDGAALLPAAAAAGVVVGGGALPIVEVHDCRRRGLE